MLNTEDGFLDAGYLVPNHITDNPDDYRAVSRNVDTSTIEDVYKQMTREGFFNYAQKLIKYSFYSISLLFEFWDTIY